MVLTSTEQDIYWMEEALKQACVSRDSNEVPIGAVIVLNENIIARGENRTLRNNDPTAHAEIIAIRKAAKIIKNHRLNGTTLYVTLEPCAMCAGALVQARISRLVYGAFDFKAGAVDTNFKVCTSEFLNHRLKITSGILTDQSIVLLQEFFKARR